MVILYLFEIGNSNFKINRSEQVKYDFVLKHGVRSFKVIKLEKNTATKAILGFGIYVKFGFD